MMVRRNISTGSEYVGTNTSTVGRYSPARTTACDSSACEDRSVRRSNDKLPSAIRKWMKVSERKKRTLTTASGQVSKLNVATSRNAR